MTKESINDNDYDNEKYSDVFGVGDNDKKFIIHIWFSLRFFHFDLKKACEDCADAAAALDKKINAGSGLDHQLSGHHSPWSANLGTSSSSSSLSSWKVL